MSESFFEKATALDRAIARGSAGCDYERDLREFLSNEKLNEYFFRNLADPSWLGMLIRAGQFDSVPQLRKSETEGTVGFPFWPQGEYLKKVAHLVPDQVCQVVAKLPPTQNARVHDSILDIALNVPPEWLTGLVPKTIEGIRSPYHLSLAFKIGSFISRLAKAGQKSLALQVAGAALEILEDVRPKADVGAESIVSGLREPVARFDLWQYEQILTKNVPDLVDVAGDSALDLLCDLLDRAILLSDREGAERRPQDLSHVWRSAIEEHQQNLNMGIRHLLVTAVRDGMEQLARKDGKLVPGIVKSLERRGESWWVFRRIALHILRRFPDSAENLLRERLTDRVLFDSAEVRHEYFLLEKECFGRLKGDQMNIILGWIEEGPKYSEAQLKRWQDFTGSPWTDEDKVRYVRQWKRDRLAPLEQYLEGKWKDFYSELLSEEGQPQHPEFTTYHEGGTWGPQSPQRQEDLVKLSAKDLAKYLADWKPTGDRFQAASPEGLSRELTGTIAREPERYASDAAEFKRLSEPTYIRAIVQGFDDALKQKQKFRWSAVLDLCVWAVGQKREVPGRNVGRFEMDAHWGWTRATVSRLLTDGFSSEENPIPFEFRGEVWKGIEVGTHDPEPTPEQEKEYFERAEKGKDKERKSLGSAKAFDPFTNSLNTPRGVAMEAVVRYALWVRSRFEKSNKKDALLGQGFDAMPEVREVLDFHLNAKNDPSVTIRTVYGQRAPWLQLLDEKWAEKNRALIFPRENPVFWHAAWDTYMGYSPPYDKVFDWLKDEYAYAVKQIGSHDHRWAQPLAPDYSLAQHLMSFLWRGKLEYESDIIRDFYRRRDAKLHGHALNFIGRSLRNTKETIPKQIEERLKGFWDKRVEAAKLQPEECAEELKEYGWWFASSKLDDEWSMHQLLEALRLAKRVEPDHLVVERLVEMAKTMPRQTIEALSMMVDGDTQGWGVLGWVDKAKEIIRTARRSGDPAARQSAEDLVNLLGSRGLFDFGELLKESAN